MDVRSFFESRYRKLGDRPEALNWTGDGQRIRFQVLSEVGLLERRTILDLGSGLGHLHRFLRKKVRAFEYTGYELSPLLVQAARQKFPNVRFEVHDVLAEKIESNYDFVMSSGMLNVETGENEKAMRLLINKAWKTSTVGVAINMLSRWANRTELGRHFYDPTAILQHARKLTRWVVFRHDYRPHDFTIYLYHKAQV